MLPPAVRCVTHCSFGGNKDDGLRDDGLMNVLAYIYGEMNGLQIAIVYDRFPKNGKKACHYL